MKKLTILVKILFIFIALISVNAHAELVLVYTDKDASTYIDDSSIEKKDKDIYMVISVRDFNGKHITGAMSSISISWVDCKSNHVALQYFQVNSGRMGEGSILDSHQINRTTFRKPKEDVQKVAQKACELAELGKFRNLEK